MDKLCERNKNITKPNITPIRYEEVGLKPPTKFLLNDFTAPFQEVVDTFSIPKYKEINPAVFTAASFPFLFGVMFGDACHGLVFLILGIFLIVKGEEWKRAGGIRKKLAELRYLVALMGFFSTYNGVVYNDFASVPLIFQESCYNKNSVRGRGIREA
jgi:V-type H+-transporting ATPase subunit a